MKKRLLPFLPDQTLIFKNRWLRPFASTLGHPSLWRFNGHGVAAGVAIGLLCGLIPGPFQMAVTILLCVILRVNLPLALFATFYTNPVTIVPIYLAAYGLGCWLLGTAPSNMASPPDWGTETLWVWLHAMGEWLFSLGYPLVLGLGIFAVVFPLVGYVLVRIGWRIWLIQRWKHRRRNRRAETSRSD